jgi:hypothetical protein
MTRRHAATRALLCFVVFRVAWALVRHAHLIRKRERGFRFPPGQSLLWRTLIDVALGATVGFGEALFALCNPPLLLRIMHAHAASSALHYGLHKRQQGTIAFPSTTVPAGTLLPVVLFVRGGAWAWGTCLAYSSFCRCLAEATGCAVINLDYRTYPDGNCDDMASDVLAALAWIHQNCDRWRCDTRRIALFGHSAGAHLVMHAILSLSRAGPADAEGCLPSSTSFSCNEQRVDSECSTSVPSSPQLSCGSHQCQLLPRSIGTDDVPALLASVRCVIGISGVYHIGAHYHHEASRSIHAGSLRLIKASCDAQRSVGMG